MAEALDHLARSSTARALAERLARYSGPERHIMEFCGGHTAAIFRAGIRGMLPPTLRLHSGPGCPVCVTSNADLDLAMQLARLPQVTLATYGDMMKVPGSRASLADLRAEGADVVMVYSTLDALDLAVRRPDREVVFFAVGFETSAPAAAAVLSLARARGVRNFSLCSVMKLTIPAAQALFRGGEVKVDGILGPGHVSAIIGAEAWSDLARDTGVPIVISGFEHSDILYALVHLVDLLDEGKGGVHNRYPRSVRPEGNRHAWDMVLSTFVIEDAVWRGFGPIPASGLGVAPAWADFDARRRFDLQPGESREHPACRCGEVLRGLIDPPSCAVFGTACTPSRPLGPCMVSDEGACAAWFGADFGAPP